MILHWYLQPFENFTSVLFVPQIKILSLLLLSPFILLQSNCVIYNNSYSYKRFSTDNRFAKSHDVELKWCIF